MSGIFGALGINDSDRVFLSTFGQAVIYDALRSTLDRFNTELNQAMGVFVESTTSNYKLRYKLPGGGRLQRTGGQAPTGAVKTYGDWDVALPLEGFGAALAGNRVDMAYMTAQDLDKHLNTLFMQDTNTVRYEILRALLNNTARTFSDWLWGSLTIQPLANNDSVVYPPVLGVETEATDNHYVTSGYASASITDTNNPYPVIRNMLEEHFGAPTGGSNVVVFINNAETSKTLGLLEFDAVNDRWIIPGVNRDQATGVPNVPGRVLGRTRSGVWVSEWRWVPSGYMLGVHLDAPAPLMKRVDLPETNLPGDLALVVQDDDYPITSSFYEHRFGVGVGNRLNGVAMQITASGSYTIPTGF